MNKLFKNLIALLGAGALTFSSAFGELPKFNNVTVTVVGDAGQNMESLNKYADDFTKAGITIKQVGATFTGLYDKLKTDFVAGSGDYDMVIFYPSYIGDFAGNGYLAPLDDLMKKTPASVWDPKLDEVEPPYREVYCKWGGKVYALPYDGDVLELYYRKDFFEDPAEKAAFKQKYNRDLVPPATWKEWLQVAEFFTRKQGDTLGRQKAGTSLLWGCRIRGSRIQLWLVPWPVCQRRRHLFRREYESDDQHAGRRRGAAEHGRQSQVLSARCVELWIRRAQKCLPER